MQGVNLEGKPTRAEPCGVPLRGLSELRVAEVRHLAARGGVIGSRPCMLSAEMYYGDTQSGACMTPPPTASATAVTTKSHSSDIAAATASAGPLRAAHS